MKKVSIVVPVYNSEKYVGYCINSILNQTYTNLEVLLINDGSTDRSLQTCKNYANIDNRIKVFDIINNGVSNARNIGISHMTGEYLQFVDSDDVIAATMTEKLVNAIETYGKDIAFCGMDIVFLEKSEDHRVVTCTSEGIGKECVLEKTVFIEKMAFLLWKTALLEGPCNKIYKTEIIRKNNIKFPLEISLGEDFLMNLQYYDFCNGAVFLSERLYYYLQVNDQALTKIPRSDLFENQMFLIGKFEAFLKNKSAFSTEAETSLAEYTTAKAMQCMITFMRAGDSDNEKEIKAQIARIINNKKIKSAIKKSEFIDERYEWITQCCEFSDVGRIYAELEKDMLEFSTIECYLEKPLTPGYINKVLVTISNKLLMIIKSKKLEMVRNSLVDYGIKVTIKKCLKY